MNTSLDRIIYQAKKMIEDEEEQYSLYDVYKLIDKYDLEKDDIDYIIDATSKKFDLSLMDWFYDIEVGGKLG